MTTVTGDRVRRSIIGHLAVVVKRGVEKAVRRNQKQFVMPHPSLNSRNGIQTVELPPEDYQVIAVEATKVLNHLGFNVTVKYDATDGVRAFIAQLR